MNKIYFSVTVIRIHFLRFRAYNKSRVSNIRVTRHQSLSQKLLCRVALDIFKFPAKLPKREKEEVIEK